MKKHKLSLYLSAFLMVLISIGSICLYKKSSGAAAVQLASPSPSLVLREKAVSSSTAGPAERRIDIAALRKSLAGRRDAEAEVQRVLAFARFQDQFADYGKNRKSMSDQDRRILAQQILGELPVHVARKEIVPVQAEALSVALLSDAEPDPAARDAAIRNMQQQWGTYARQMVGPLPSQDPRFQAYSQQARQIVDQVQATVRDPQQQQTIVSQRLQTLRTQIYDGEAPAGTN